MMADENTFQMRRGENIFGSPIGEYNSDVALSYGKHIPYGEFKQQLSSYHAPDNVPDLFLTGEFQDDLFAEVKNDGVLFDSKDDKSILIEEQYGEEIFGVQQKSMNVIMVEQAAPELAKSIIKELLK